MVARATQRKNGKMRVPEIRRLSISCGLSDAATKAKLVARLRKHVADGGGVVAIVAKTPMKRRNHLRDASKAKAKAKADAVANAKVTAVQPGAVAEALVLNDAFGAPCDLASSDAFHRDRTPLSGAAYAALMEVHYNLARFHHQLGTTHLAVSAYRRVLALADQRREDIAAAGEGGEARAQHGPAREAAYNLVQIYRASGALGLARVVMSRYLAV